MVAETKSSLYKNSKASGKKGSKTRKTDISYFESHDHRHLAVASSVEEMQWQIYKGKEKSNNFYDSRPATSITI